jgi:hypothetical protein
MASNPNDIDFSLGSANLYDIGEMMTWAAEICEVLYLLINGMLPTNTEYLAAWMDMVPGFTVMI